MQLKLSDDRKKHMVEEIQVWFRNEQEQNIGELKAEMLLDFFIDKIAPGIYNQAIGDASSFIHEKLIDLESILYIEE